MDKSRKEGIATLLTTFEAVGEELSWGSVSRLIGALKTILRGEFNPDDWDYFESSKGHMSGGPDENYFSCWEICPYGSSVSLEFSREKNTVTASAVTGSGHAVTISVKYGRVPAVKEIICDKIRSSAAWRDEDVFMARFPDAEPWELEALRAAARARRIEAILRAALISFY